MAKKSETKVWKDNAEFLGSLMKIKHECPTIWKYDDEDKYPNGDVKAEAKLNEYWVNDECAYGYCEYCYGHRYNKWFLEKPTQKDIDEFILKQQIKSDIAEKTKKNEYYKILARKDEGGQLITLCINQNYKQVPKLATEIISVIRNIQYSFIIDGYACIELYGKGENWNPHIHIVTRKVKRLGVVAQALRRKFQNDKYQIYRVDVKSVPYEEGSQYVDGIKVFGKQEASNKDKEYREENNLYHIYKL